MDQPRAADGADPGAGDPPGRWVELRVHGVSGTPPENILDSAFAVQVAGDDRARFFRPADSAGRERQPVTGVPGRCLEAYHWGRFTSGSWTQALWLLIIPFGVLNAASFTLPPPVSAVGRAAAAVAAAALRVVGLAMTCLLVFASVTAAMDLGAWQRQGAGTGGGAQWWSVAGAALPVGAVVLFFIFGRTHDGGQDPARDAGGHADAPRTSGAGLADADFFAGDPDAPALRRLHCAAPLHLVAMLLLWPAADASDRAAVVGRGLAIALIAVNLLVVALLGDPRRADAGVGWHRLGARLSWVLFVLGVVLLAAAALLVGLREAPTAPAGPAVGLPGIAPAAFGLLSVTVVALVVLLVATAGLAAVTAALPAVDAAGRPWSAAVAEPGGRRRVERAYGRFVLGMTAWALGAVAAFLAVGFAAAFVFAAQAALRAGAADRALTVTPLLQRVAYAWGLTVVLLVALGLVAVAGLVAGRRRFAAAARAAFAREAQPPAGLPPAWVDRVGRATYLARLKNALPAVCALLATVGLLLSAVAGVEHLWGDRISAAGWWGGTVGRLSGLSADPWGGLVWLGTMTLTALSAALVVLGRGALRAEKARRGLNVVWDVVAFWPRRAHPFVPPPYSLHVVAGLRRRISWHLGTLHDPDTAPPAQVAERVVVAAHSQGSLIAVTALLWASRAEAGRIGLVTFGSQLRQQFVRAFPAAVDVELLARIWDHLGGRWRNLYRDTDAIAGPVLSWGHGAVTGDVSAVGWFGADAAPVPVVRSATGRVEYGPEWRLLDPERHDIDLMAGPMDRLRGHGDYPHDPDWDAAVEAVLPPADPPPAAV